MGGILKALSFGDGKRWISHPQTEFEDATQNIFTSSKNVQN
jgi:hypothetical protein